MPAHPSDLSETVTSERQTAREKESKRGGIEEGPLLVAFLTLRQQSLHIFPFHIFHRLSVVCGAGSDAASGRALLRVPGSTKKKGGGKACHTPYRQRKRDAK
jgi:hypothetical protein